MAAADKDLKTSLKNPDFWHTINIGYVGAGLATLTTALLSIKGSFFKNFHESKIGKALEKTRNKALTEALETANGDFSVYLKGVKAAESNFEKAVHKYLKPAGFSDNIFKRTVQQFRTLKPHQQAGVGLTFAAVTLVGVGALLSNLHTRKFNHLLNEEEQSRQH